MTYPDVRFVDSPTAAAATLFDFNDIAATPWRQVDAEGFSFGSPSLEGDPDAIDPLYGDREVAFTFSIKGTKAQAAALTSTLARLLLAGPGWLRYQSTASADVIYFRTLRATPGAMSMDLVQTTSTTKAEWWSVEMRLPAEEFAYGERVTQSVQTVNNDPAHATNPCRILLPAIEGDAPTPLRISVNPSNAAATHGYRWMLNLHAGATQRNPIVWPIGGTDGWTVGTDTGASTPNAAYSGGSYRPVTFATDTSLVNRLSGTAPSTMSPGLYKVLVRFARSDTSSVFSLRFGQVVLTAFEYGETVVTNRATSTATGHATWVDLGNFILPTTALPPRGENQGFSFAPSVALQMARLSGSGAANLDAIMLVPLEAGDTDHSSTLFSWFRTVGIPSGAGSGIWDGNLEAFWAYDLAGRAFGAVPDMEGSFPLATPGQSNVLTVLQQVNGGRPLYGSDASDDIADSSVVTVSYQPQWLYIGDS